MLETSTRGKQTFCLVSMSTSPGLPMLLTLSRLTPKSACFPRTGIQKRQGPMMTNKWQIPEELAVSPKDKNVLLRPMSVRVVSPLGRFVPRCAWITNPCLPLRHRGLGVIWIEPVLYCRPGQISLRHSWRPFIFCFGLPSYRLSVSQNFATSVLHIPDTHTPHLLLSSCFFCMSPPFIFVRSAVMPWNLISFPCMHRSTRSRVL